MPAGDLTITIDGKDAGAHAVFVGLSADQKKLVSDFGKVGVAAEAAADQSIKAVKREQKERNAQVNLGKRLVRQNESVEESYKREVAALIKARKDGEISTESYRATVDRLKTKIREEGEAAELAALKATTAYKEKEKSIEVGIRKVGDLKRANQTLDQQYDELRRSIKTAFDAGKISASEYETSLRELDAEHKRLSSSQETSFGSKSMKQVASYAASILSVTAAVGIVREALEFMNAEKEKAFGSTESLVDIRRSLRQVSKGDFNELESRADELTQFGIDRVEARQLVFDARSTGFEGEEAAVAAADPVIKIEDGAAFAGEFRKFFAGDDLTIEQAFNTALAGAAESQFNISDLLPQIRKAAQGQLAGGESSDVVAATGVLASNFGESTGDRLRAFGVKLATTTETKGLNLIDAVDKLISDPELTKGVIGDSSELKSVFAKFSERRDEIVAADKRIETEQQKTGADGLLGKAIRETYDGSTKTGRVALARLDANRSAVAREIGQEAELSETEYSNRAFIDRKVGDANGGFEKFVTDKLLRTQAYFGTDLQKFQDNSDKLDSAVFGTDKPDESRDARNSILTEQMTVLKTIAENTKPQAASAPPSPTRPNQSFSRPLQDK